MPDLDPPKDRLSSVTVPGDPFGSRKEAVVKESLKPEEVAKIHDRSDVDSSAQAQHHTLGIKHDQSSPGDHKHDGKSSRRLAEDLTLNGVKSGGTALTNLIDMLQQLLGFEDNTT